jgi:hypothetical protein
MEASGIGSDVAFVGVDDTGLADRLYATYRLDVPIFSRARGSNDRC